MRTNMSNEFNCASKLCFDWRLLYLWWKKPFNVELSIKRCKLFLWLEIYKNIICLNLTITWKLTEKLRKTLDNGTLMICRIKPISLTGKTISALFINTFIYMGGFGKYASKKNSFEMPQSKEVLFIVSRSCLVSFSFS